MMWGQMKEKENLDLKNEDCSLRSASQKTPLLQKCSEDA